MPRPRRRFSPLALAAPPPDDVFADGALTIREAAAQFGESRTKLKELIRLGELAWSKPGKNVLIAKRSLVARLEKHRQPR